MQLIKYNRIVGILPLFRRSTPLETRMRGVLFILVLLCIVCVSVSDTTSSDVNIYTAILPIHEPAATALRFATNKTNTIHPDGTIISCDSRGWILSKENQEEKRWFAVGGEIQYGRVPKSQWRESLLRIRAGGLDVISVYAFWIHHEEEKGKFNWGGRRNISAFLDLANEVGLKVLLRIGPWDHGECRNGGHPDWAITSCGKLRSSDPQYLTCVEGWYEALANQIVGKMWKDGGPIIAVQVDNESRDWKYLLVLKSMAENIGMYPPFFTKTGWPTPDPGYPDNYPMVPFYGGYPDAFFVQDWMKPGVNPSLYQFESKKKPLPGYPWLDIEIGGGMASSYNHRVHMSPSDMPSLHLVDLGKGVNQLGYYMYHGGNNPLSTKFPLKVRNDPRNTLQESSFQPAGPRNSMPSLSYDFFAPLGEFSQVRPHFHMMRRLHLSLGKDAWGDEIASTVNVNVQSKSNGNKKSTLRWTLRAAEKKGFLFVNNYERLKTLPVQENVRFQLEWKNSSTSFTIPSLSSDPINIPPGLWFVWPFNLALCKNQIAGAPILQYATAQLLTRVSLNNTSTIFMVQSHENIFPEVALQLGDARIMKHTGKISYEGDIAVIKNIVPMLTAPSLVLQYGTNIIQILVLPTSAKDQVWVGNYTGINRVFFSEDFQLLFPDGNNLELRNVQGKETRKIVFMYPPVAMLHDDNDKFILQEPDGIFGKYILNIPMEDIKSYIPKVQLVKKAGPARKIPLVNGTGHGKPQEPSAEDWLAAEEYDVEINLPDNFNSSTTEVRLAINYVGDAARVYYGNKLLTDNWYSGYVNDGRCEVGLSYLAEENPGLLKKGSKLRLLLLPLTEKALQDIVYLQPALWPKFNGSKTVLKLITLEPILLQRTSLKHIQFLL